MSDEISATTRPGLIDRVGEKVERRVSAILRTVRPRVSLLTGGVFVLITLHLPLAVNGCGDYSGPGRDIVQGKPHSYWPSYTTLMLDAGAVGRWFYIFLLAWAAFAVLLTLASGLRRGILGWHSLVKTLFAIGGATSFLVLADYCALFVGGLGGSLLRWAGVPEDIRSLPSIALALLTLLVCVRCLRAKSVRASMPVRLVFIFGGGLGALAAELVWIVWIALYILAPLSLWYRHALWPGRDSRSHWIAVRRRLALIFVPAVAGQFWAAYAAVDGVWGLIPCLVGIHLITLGYMRLAQQAEAARAPIPVPTARPAEQANAAG